MQLAKRKFGRIVALALATAGLSVAVSHQPLAADSGSNTARQDDLRKSATWNFPNISVFEQHPSATWTS